MNLDTATTPRPQNYKKYSSSVFFLPGVGLNPLSPPAGAAWINLGNCTMSQQKHGLKTADSFRNRGGTRQRVGTSVTEYAPELDITIDEVGFRKAIPTRIFGTQGPDLAQGAATALTLTIAAVYQNNTYDLGKRNLTTVAVTYGSGAGTAATVDVDYQVDPIFGTITIMEGAIPDSTQVTASPITVTFACAAFTRATFTEYTTTDQPGLLRWFAEDSSIAGVAIEKIALVNLLPQDPGANDVAKYKEDKLTAKISGRVYRWDRKD